MSLHKGDIGAVIRLTTDLDISGASALSVKYRKPSGTTGSWTGTLNGTNNLQYTTTDADDLDEAGDWSFQGLVTGVSGWTGHTTEKTATILDTI